MNKLIVTRGIPGSGKTTFAKKWVLEDPEGRVRINQDDIRRMMGKYWVPSRERLTKMIFLLALSAALTLKYDIVLDNMNMDPVHFEKLVRFIKGRNKRAWLFHPFSKRKREEMQYEIEEKRFTTPLKVCIKRDSKREEPIGAKKISSIYNKYKKTLKSWSKQD